MRITALALVLGLLVPAPAWAQSWVAFLHTPPEVQHADADLVLAGSVIGAGASDRLVVRYRTSGQTDYREVPVTPAYGDTYQAVIPAAEVAPPAVEYYVAVVGAKGADQAIFASAAQPQVVRVVGGDGRPVARATPPRQAAPTPAPGPAAAPERAPSTARTAPPPETPARVRSAPDRPSADSDLAEELALFAAEDSVTLATLKSQSVAQAPAIISVVSDHQMRAMGARTLVDVLKKIPGLETSRDVQGFWRLAVRGIRSDPEVLLLYDGHRLANLYDGRNLYELPIEDIDRVEVIRGPGSALYGTGAFLTVINVVPSTADGAQVSASYDSHGIATGYAAYGLRLGGGSLRADAEVEGGPGYAAAIDKDAYREDGKTAAGVTNDAHTLVSGGVRGVHPLGPGEVTWFLRGLYQDRGALIGAFDTVGPESRLLWRVLLADAAYRLPVTGGELSFRFQGDLQTVDRLFQLSPAPLDTPAGTFPDGAFERIRHASRSLGVDATGRFDLFEGNSLTVGLGATQQALTAYDYEVNFDPMSGQPLAGTRTVDGAVAAARDPGLTQRLVLGIFAQDAWTVTRGLDVTLGVRADLFSGGVGRSDPAAPTGTQGDAFALNPRLGFVWQPSEQWSFKALYATAFRVPTFEELTSRLLQGDFTRGRFEGNATLDPVTIRTTELGVEHAFDSGQSKVRLRANGFVNQFFGRIEALDLTGNVTPLYNRTGETRVYGLEGEGRIDLSPRDRITAGAAWFRAIDTQAPEGRNLLTDVPQLRFILQAQLGLGAYLDLHLSTVLGTERRNNARSSLEALRRFRIPAYALVDATLLTRPIAGTVTFALTIENALDQPYLDDVPRPDRIPGLVPGPGLGARLTARASF